MPILKARPLVAAAEVLDQRDVIVPPQHTATENLLGLAEDGLDMDGIEIGVATDEEVLPLIGSIDTSSPVTGKIEDWTLVAVRISGVPTPDILVVGQYLGKHIRKTSPVRAIAADFRTVRTMNSVYELGEKAVDPLTALLAVILMRMRHEHGGEMQVGEYSLGGCRSWMM